MRRLILFIVLGAVASTAGCYSSAGYGPYDDGYYSTGISYSPYY